MQRLPDRTFAYLGAKSAFYLFRQPFIWISGLLGAIGAGVSLYWTAIANGKSPGDILPLVLGLSPVLGLGLAVLTALPSFLIWRAVHAEKKRFAPHEGETLLEESRANHFLGDEGRGGRLYLTDRRLLFLPHRFNVQLDSVEIALEAVRAVGWRRILRGAQLMSTTVELETTEGRPEVFVIGEAERVAARIEEARR